MLRDSTLLELNQKTYPGCYPHRSHPQDVARTEQLTFICTRNKGTRARIGNINALRAAGTPLVAALPVT